VALVVAVLVAVVVVALGRLASPRLVLVQTMVVTVVTV
jgi:hypothetical protein